MVDTRQHRQKYTNKTRSPDKKLKKSRKKYKPPTPGEKLCHPRMSIRSMSRSRHTCLDSKAHKLIMAHSQQETNCKSNDEICLINKSNLSENDKQKLLKDYFRPKAPSEWLNDPDMWLTNKDIENVMKQYEEAYPNFKFLGAVPIDFSAPDPYNKLETKCIVDTFCHVNLKSLKKDKKTIAAAVFNLDPHFKGGSHWVSLVILLGKGVYYFDSYGIQPPLQISRFMRSLTLQDSSLELGCCGRRFQYSNTECGMYSLYFIIRMIMGDSFKDFCKRAIDDKWMLLFRKYLFRIA